MSSIAITKAILEIKKLEDFAYKTKSSIHQLDARVKVLLTFFFSIIVISFDKYEISALLPFALFPIVMLSKSQLPALFILKKMVLICPFVLMVGIFNPILDRDILIHIGSLGVSAGWISFFSILIRSSLTVGALLILVGVSGFAAICRALSQLGVPRIFAIQLLFVYRYIFVLAEEGLRISRSREIRSFENKGLGIKSFSSMIGNLLLRTWVRAERIHLAMLARGFKGEFPEYKTSHLKKADYFYFLSWISLFLLLRLENASLLIIKLLVKIL